MPGSGATDPFQVSSHGPPPTSTCAFVQAVSTIVSPVGLVSLNERFPYALSCTLYIIPSLDGPNTGIGLADVFASISTV